MEYELVNYIESMKCSYNEIANNKAVKILKEIQSILDDGNTDDFGKIDEIVGVFIRNNLSTDCHDFL